MRKYYDYHFENGYVETVWFEGETLEEVEDQAFYYQFGFNDPIYIGYTDRGIGLDKYLD